MEELILGLSLIAIFVLCYFAVSRFGKRMDPSYKAALPERREGAEPPVQETPPVVLIAADSRVFGRLRRETEHEKINLM